MAKTKELGFSISKDNLNKLIDTLKDLSRLDDKILFKFDKEHTLIYSLVGEGNTVNAFKSFIYKTSEIFDIEEFDETIMFIGKSAKSMARSLFIMSDFDIDTFEGKIYYDELGESFFSDRIYFRSGNKLRQSFYGDDPRAMNTQISVDKIKQFIKLDDADFSFDLNASDFDKIKKLATPDVEMNIFYMNTFEKDGEFFVSIGEGAWELTVAETEYSTPRTLAFPKKYFKTIGMVNGSAKIYVFDTSLMVSTPESDLLISIEITV
jgi:hypothetical protein